MASSNTVQILINAKDNASSALNKVSGEVDRFGNTSHASVEKASTSWLGMGTVIGAVSGIVSNVASRAIDTLTDSLDSAIKRVDTLNNSSKVFQNLGFRAEDVSAAMSELKDSILGLPTSLDQAVQGMQSLALQSGDIRLARKEFTAMNDAVLASGHSTADLENAIQQITQLDMEGPLDAQTWNSLKQSGLEPALSAMAKMSGVTMAQLKEQFGDGTLKVRDFMEKLQELDIKGTGNMASLSKQAKDMTGGIGTGIENAKTAITRGVATIIDAIGSERISNAIAKSGKTLENALKTIADNIIPAYENARIVARLLWDTISGGDPTIKASEARFAGLAKVLAQLRDILGPSIEALANTITRELGPSLKKLTPYMDDVARILAGLAGRAIINNLLFIINMLNLVAKAIAFVINDFFAVKNAIGTTVDWISDRFRTFRKVTTDVWNAVGDAVKARVDWISDEIDSLQSFLSSVWDGVVDAAWAAWQAVYTNSIKPVIDLITAYIRVVGTVASYVWDWIKAVSVLAWHWIYDNAVKPVLDAIAVALNWVATTATTVWNAIALAASTAWNWLYANVIQPVVNAIVVAVNWMGGVISTVWDWIKNTAATAWHWVGDQASAAWNWVVGVWQSAVGWFSSVWNSIGGAAVAPANSIKSTFTSVMESIKGVVKGSVNWIIDMINSMIGKVNSVADKVPGAPKLGTIPRFALGTNYAPGGMALVGENGPELVDLPRGSRVTPNTGLGSALQQAAPSVTNNIYGNITLGDASAVDRWFERLDRSGQLAAKGLAS